MQIIFSAARDACFFFVCVRVYCFTQSDESKEEAEEEEQAEQEAEQPLPPAAAGAEAEAWAIIKDLWEIKKRHMSRESHVSQCWNITTLLYLSKNVGYLYFT